MPELNHSPPANDPMFSDTEPTFDWTAFVNPDYVDTRASIDAPDLVQTAAINTDASFDTCAIDPALFSAPLPEEIFTALPDPVPTPAVKQEEQPAKPLKQASTNTRPSPAERAAKRSKANPAAGAVHALVDVNLDWDDKPAPEIYNKLSSKEKRQWRNKASSRIYRARRQEHLNTLEDTIKQRDATIDDMRVEMDSLREENKSLRMNVESLKQMLDDIQNKLNISPATAHDDLPALSPASSTVTDSADELAIPELPRRASSSRLSMPKPHLKDRLPSASSTWGASSPLAQNFNHINAFTTLIPEPSLSSRLSSKLQPDYSLKKLSLPQESVSPTTDPLVATFLLHIYSLASQTLMSQYFHPLSHLLTAESIPTTPTESIELAQMLSFLAIKADVEE